MRNPIHLARLALAWARLTRDLEGLDEVLAMNELMMKLRRPEDDQKIVAEFASGAAGAAALATRMRLGRPDLGALAELPPETLGGAYARFMAARGLVPDSLPELDPDDGTQYVLAHFYETHDLWHVVTGFDTDAAGEIGLQAFYLAQAQTYLPFLVMSAALLNTFLFAYDEKHRRLDALSSGWRAGKAAKSFLGVDWKAWFPLPLAEVRQALGVMVGA